MGFSGKVPMMQPFYRTAGTFHLLSTPAALTTPRRPQSGCDGLSHFKRTQASPHASVVQFLAIPMRWRISRLTTATASGARSKVCKFINHLNLTGPSIDHLWNWVSNKPNDFSPVHLQAQHGGLLTHDSQSKSKDM